MSMKYIKPLSTLTIDDVPLVGGKNASLGQMMQHLADKDLRIPNGFAVTAQAYRYFLEHNNLVIALKAEMNRLSDPSDISALKAVGAVVRSTIENGRMPDDLAQEIIKAYQQLSEQYGQNNCDVAVRSSATAEDLPTASFAGQQETFLNVRGTQQLLEACKRSMASLFTDRAIVYRIEHGFDHFEVALSVGVQKMVRSDKACAGVMFTLDTESGFKDTVMIDASYGLGEAVVKGTIIPDEFRVFKPLLAQNVRPIITKKLGVKDSKLIYTEGHSGSVQKVEVSLQEQGAFCLSEDEILELSRSAVVIEQHYTKQAGKWMPMDIEWAKDGEDGKLYIVQARPETVHAGEQTALAFKQYTLTEKNVPALLQGISIGQKIATGRARCATSYNDLGDFQEGDILVTTMTDPDWVPIMRQASAIVTERGGRTSHAAIVSRELGTPAIVGATGAMDSISTGNHITVDCSQGSTGYVYDGQRAFAVQEINLQNVPQLPVELMLNIGDPDSAFKLAKIPNAGVGLARIEFIIANYLHIHPMAAVQPEAVTDTQVRAQIEACATGYESVEQFVIHVLAQGMATIAAAFYPNPVIVRFSDFKSNEYRSLLGGQFFEPEEENPMLGLRGASRYYSQLYHDAFVLECQAAKYAREIIGLENIKLMVPFVRTLKEAECVQEIMKRAGLERATKGLEVIMMCEVPSNVIMLEQFAAYYDGFSIGSNDLTQTTLAVDRDSQLLADLFNEQDPAVQEMMKLAIRKARACDSSIGICGQGPSDYPELALFLIEQGVSSISLNPDVVLPFLFKFAKISKH